MIETVIHMYETLGHRELLLYHRGKVSPEWIHTMIYEHTGEELTDEEMDEFHDLVRVLLAMIFALEVQHHPDDIAIERFTTFARKEMDKYGIQNNVDHNETYSGCH